MLGGCSQEVQRAKTSRFSVGDDSRHERAADAVRAPFRGNRERSQECVVAADFEPRDADQSIAGVRDDEVTESSRTPSS